MSYRTYLTKAQITCKECYSESKKSKCDYNRARKLQNDAIDLLQKGIKNIEGKYFKQSYFESIINLLNTAGGLCEKCKEGFPDSPPETYIDNYISDSFLMLNKIEE